MKEARDVLSESRTGGGGGTRGSASHVTLLPLMRKPRPRFRVKLRIVSEALPSSGDLRPAHSHSLHFSSPGPPAFLSRERGGAVQARTFTWGDGPSARAARPRVSRRLLACLSAVSSYFRWRVCRVLTSGMPARHTSQTRGGLDPSVHPLIRSCLPLPLCHKLCEDEDAVLFKNPPR